MKTFMDKDFLLENDTAKILYHNFAEGMPICDFHCHISPKEIAEDRKFDNITQIWLGGDHYKWRVLRTNGIDEDYITGKKSDKDKFLKWAETVPYTIGNPIYHWTHLELQRYFNIYETLSPSTAEDIWNKCNQKLQSGELTVRSLIKMSNVKVICTTDDPTDSLNYHEQILNDKDFDVKILPGFRPDKAINIEVDCFNDWVNKLENVTNKKITDLDSLTEALKQRMKRFKELGCFISDHALDEVVFEKCTKKEVDIILKKRLNNERISETEIKKYKTYMLLFLGREYFKLGWAMQYHIGALRDNSSRMLKKLGRDSGFDSINDRNIAKELSKLLDNLDSTGELPKTILYCLNPSDNEVIASMIGNFQGGSIRGKIQFGSGWWFNDQKDGMERQMEALSQLGLISYFVGMVTDSRSFLSYTRHEYFRRILCNKIGKLVENGEYPNDINFLGKIIKGICYENAIKYFNIK